MVRKVCLIQDMSSFWDVPIKLVDFTSNIETNSDFEIANLSLSALSTTYMIASVLA